MAMDILNEVRTSNLQLMDVRTEQRRVAEEKTEEDRSLFYQF